MSTATSPAPQFRLRRAPRSARRPHAGSDRDRRHDPQVSPGARPAARQGSASAPSRRVIVIVECSTGRLGCRVFFSTEATLDVVNVLETYAGRWGIEVFFREAKQLLGFADSQARKQAAVLRVAPLVGLLYSGLVLWFAEAAESEGAQLDPAECMTERAFDLDLAARSQRACALGEPTLRDGVQVVEIDD